MVLGGIGGANTQTGKWFEIKTDLKTALTEADYNITDFVFCKQHDFPKYFKEQTQEKMEDIFGKKFLPDEAIIYNNVLYVIEKKTQNGTGSVDEKIQTGPYKLEIYRDCAKRFGLIEARFIYLLSDSFNASRYTKHQIPYLNQHNIQVYFEKLPINEIFN